MDLELEDVLIRRIVRVDARGEDLVVGEAVGRHRGLAHGSGCQRDGGVAVTAGHRDRPGVRLIAVVPRVGGERAVGEPGERRRTCRIGHTRVFRAIGVHDDDCSADDRRTAGVGDVNVGARPDWWRRDGRVLVSVLLQPPPCTVSVTGKDPAWV